MKSTQLSVFILLLLTWSAQLSIAQPIHAIRVGTTNYSSPVLVTAPPGDTSRLFVVEETGNIKIVDAVTGIPFSTPFLTVPHVTGAGEMGLLGLAFHPNYANNSDFFYVYYNTAAVSPNPAGRMIARFHVTADPNVADPASATTIFFFASVDGIHNGGWTAFGPDGYLYVAWGNRGVSTNSPLLTTPLGKLLRFDVNGPDGIPGTADDDQFPADPNRNFCVPADNPFAGSPTNRARRSGPMGSATPGAIASTVPPATSISAMWATARGKRWTTPPLRPRQPGATMATRAWKAFSAWEA